MWRNTRLKLNSSPPSVVLTRCTDYNEKKISAALQGQFNLLGGLQKFVKHGDSVLIKPNLIAPKSRCCATQTDPTVIYQTAKLLKDFGAKPFVADSPAWGNIFTCIKKLKLEEPLKKLDVPVRQLKKPRKCDINGTTVGISSLALDTDVIINLPKFKSHQQLVATFAVKNMFGAVTGKKKAYWHFAKGKNTEDFCRFLIGIYNFLRPALTIIDAVTVMDGPGPISGRPRPLGYLIGGIDPFSCEIVCCKLINLNPANVPIIAAARKMGLTHADFDHIEILGDAFPKEPCTDFELPKLIPMRFSLLRVCKSILKQIILLAKSAVKSGNNDRN
jgi:uncharacterized protein (DUF362 family)